MTRLRRFLHARLWLALALIVVALSVRIAVPPGTMPARGPGGATLVACSGSMAASGMRAMPGMTVKDGAPVKAEPCAYTALLAAALDTIDLPQLETAALKAAVLAPVAARVPAERTMRWRPPLRGPPLAA